MNTLKNKLFIIPNLSDSKYYVGITDAIDKLESNGFKTSISEKDSIILYGTTAHSLFDVFECDYIVTLGGDGSFLIGAQTAILSTKPIFGVNFGHRGYLCLFDKNELDTITPLLLDSKSLLNNPVLELNYHDNIFYSVNEFMAAKDNFGGSIQLNITIESMNPMYLRGDGVIVSTPIGSTSYNATCGGHILKRESNEFVVTPILKNTGDLTSTIYKNTKNAIISNANPKYKVNIFSDGRLVGPLEEDIKIQKSNKILITLK